MWYILHVDGDSFFASCEIARLPHLKGKPVVVGEDRGIVCAASFEAKKLGITRAMPIFKVRDQFPQVTILPSHFELYEQYAQKLFRTLEPHVDILERYSIDECFALIRFPDHYDEKNITGWLTQVKETVQTTIGVTYSFGLARTKVLAKIASKYKKPDGCTVVFAHQEKGLLKQIPIESVWGIGWGLEKRFKVLRIKTAFELSEWTESQVQQSFSLPVQELWHELNGKSIFCVSPSSTQPKSLQSTRSFQLSNDPKLVMAELLQNVDVVCSRMRQYGLVTKSISFYLKTSERRYHSDVIALPHYSENPLDIFEKITHTAEMLFKRNIRYRSTGVTAWALRPKDSIEYDFFGYQKGVDEKARITKTIDDIRKRFGNTSIGFLSVLPSMLQRQQKIRARLLTDTFVSGLPLPYLGEVQ